MSMMMPTVAMAQHKAHTNGHSVVNQYPTRIHRLIDEEGIVMLPGIYDGLSAAVLQQVGFSAGFISGYSVSASYLGKPDIGLLTPPEMAAAARTICDAAPAIPFIADADTGGGNALNVHRTVKDLINAGAAGCFLEDQAWPKKCGHMGGKQVIPAEEHAMKIRAARNAIGNADFFLVARTDARAVDEKYGLADAINRANMYIDAGADACFVEAPRNLDELREVARKTKGYKVVNMIEGGKTPLCTAEEFKAMGFHLMVHSLTSIYAASRAMHESLKTLKDYGTTRGHLHQLATFKDFNNLIGLESWVDIERQAAAPNKFKIVNNYNS